MRALAHAFVDAARLDSLPFTHPELGDVGPLAFVCFAGPVDRVPEGGYRARSATYVHPGVICSCPTGTGTSARIAVLRADGRIEDGDVLETVSPSGSTITGTLLGDTRVGPHAAVRSTIAGRAFTLARSQIVVDPHDPLLAQRGHLP
jgi:proline racemase